MGSPEGPERPCGDRFHGGFFSSQGQLGPPVFSEVLKISGLFPEQALLMLFFSLFQDELSDDDVNHTGDQNCNTKSSQSVKEEGEQSLST